MKAVIPAAGLGSRFLPATKAIPKEMLPVLDKPVIQYIVEEALAASADEIIIVNSEDKVSIENHFSPSPDLVSQLRASGKDAFADAVEYAGNLPVSYVYQTQPLGLGHAVWCASEKTKGQPFYVLLGDTMVPSNNVLTRMLEVSKKYNDANVIAVFPVPDDQVSRFGVIDGSAVTEEPDLWKIDRLVEKPPLETAPSNLAIFGRYLLSPRVMELLCDASPTIGGEIQLTEALDKILSEEEMYAVIIDASDGFDTGTIETWMETNIKMALNDSRLKDFAQSLIKENG